MLATFPELLFLSPLAIALIRVALGASIVLTAHALFAKHDAYEDIRFPVVGRVPRSLVSLGIIGYATVGGLIILGAWTQPVALLACLGTLKLMVLGRIYPGLALFPRSTLALMCVMALALVFTGSGALALDLPL